MKSVVLGFGNGHFTLSKRYKTYTLFLKPSMLELGNSSYGFKTLFQFARLLFDENCYLSHFCSRGVYGYTFPDKRSKRRFFDLIKKKVAELDAC